MALLRRSPLALLGTLLLVLVLVGSAFAPLITPYSPIQVSVGERLSAPTFSHPFGTDLFGRDVLSRILYGGRSTLSISVLVLVVAFAVGVPLGFVSGIAGGRIDVLLMRLVDAWLSFPSLVLAIALASALGPSLRNAMLAVAITLAPQFARLARAQALVVATQPYVESARAIGVNWLRLMVSYVLPNSLGPLLIQVSLSAGSAILQTASLGFLGLGAQPPLAEWGADVSANTRFLRESPWVAIAPGMAILLTVLAFNLLGDALADWLNPRSRNR